MNVVDEEARLDALHELRLLDTPPSESFDRITRMASQIFSLPIAAVSLTDRDRQWFKSRVGVTHSSIDREKAPCALVAETGTNVVVNDLLADPRYSSSRLANDGVRFYAGAALVTREGYGLGALCVLGTEPRTATVAEMEALNDLAAMVMSQIELQHSFGRIDPLSGLPNRNQFLDDLEDLARDCSTQRRIAVLVDLAHSKEINNLLRVMGAGRIDDLVRDAAKALRGLLGSERTAYHIGATQFAFVSPPNVDKEAYLALLASGFAAARAESNVRFVTTVALGVVPFTAGEVRPRDLLRQAHNAAQDARRSDGAVGTYSASSEIAHRRQLRLINDWGSALEDTNQLRLVFQPRVDLASGACVGAEALLRWHHPELGEVSPAEFIPLVEQTSMVEATTSWVVGAAIRQLAAWRRTGFEKPVSVNVSAANLDEHGFAHQLQLQLLKYHVRPELLEVEVTESAIMTDSGRAIACLEELKRIGIRIAIDDFGTGQSSLAYLQSLPASVVKIDQSFVRDLTACEDRSHVLVSTMIALFHKLGYRVVAEGIETSAAALTLAALGCDEGQGYLFARPMEARNFPDWIESQHAALETSHKAA